MSTNKSILFSASSITLGTVISRIFGFFRDIMLAGYLGTGIFAQAFVVAFRIPNLLRTLFGEGLVNAVFVPVFSGYLEKGETAQFWKLSTSLFKRITLILFFAVSLGAFVMPFVVRFIAPGFIQDPEKLRVTIELSRLMFPYILLISVAVYLSSILNSHKMFFLPAINPAVLNIVIIVTLVLFSSQIKTNIMPLGIAVLVAGLMQIVILVPSLFKKGFKVQFLMTTDKDENLALEKKKILKLSMPRVFSSAVYQISVFVDTILASLASIVGEGAIAAIYYANRIIQFPLAVFSFAITTAALPTLSRQASTADLSSFRKTVSFSLENIMFILMPISVFLLVLSEPIIQIIFQRGEFGQYSTLITSRVLFFYSFGLLFFGASRMLSASFYALQDTFTPLKSAVISLVVNIILDLTLMFPLGVGGLALASAVASFVNAAILFKILDKRLGFKMGSFLMREFIKISFASVILGFVLKYVWSSFVGINQFLLLALVMFIGVVSFLLFSLIFKVDVAKRFMAWIRKR
ncbi:MAG: murein biosynthesis integral membrane protein MurJ [Candidatus Gygaella obscura]|nr:murein biosynthesis integral membrane protein MurJ [Candidatus Gygaella obscura]